MLIKRHLFYYILILAICLSASLTGCRKTGHAFSSADSVRIKQVEAMQRRGSDYRNSCDFTRAIAVHDSCIKIAKEMGDTMQYVIGLNNQGTNFRRLGSLNEASQLHYRALALCDQYSDTSSFNAKKNVLRSLNGLGNILMTLGNYEASEEMFRRALAGEENLQSATGQAINLANIGSIKHKQGLNDSAAVYYTLSLKKNMEAKNDVGISLCNSYLGEIDEENGDMQAALAHYRESFTIGKATGDVWHWLTPCIALAKLYHKENNLDSALIYTNTGLAAAYEIHSSEHLRDLYSLRSFIDEKMGNMVLAYQDLKRCRQYNDSVLSAESRNQVQNLRVNYEANRRNEEVKKAEEKAENSRMVRDMVIIVTVVIFVFLAIGTVQYRRNQATKRKVAAERDLFYRNVTHQLRTPMTVVLGMVNQLQNHISKDDRMGMESLAAAQRQSKNLLELIKQLIAASKEGKAPLLTPQGDIIEFVSPQQKETAATAIRFADLPADIKLEGASTILVAEDNDDVAMMICALLRDKGYVVSRASDGQEAWEMLQDDLPDLLLTDIAMPRMDGLQLMRHVREEETMSHLPIIVASARVEDSERIEGINAGAEVYLTKPFIPEELLLRVRKILEQRELIRHRFMSSTSDDHSALGISSAEQDFLTSLNAVIDQNMTTGEVNTAFLAEKLFASASTINRKVKNITGMSSTIYIRNRRLTVAKRLLSTTTKSITEVETLCGFNTPGYFSRLFKAEVGCSPSEYRQNAEAIQKERIFNS